LDVAENIKIKYGSTLPDKIRETEQINLASLDPAEDERVSRKHVAEIIEARMSEIFQMIKEELQKVGKDGVLPGGIVFTGGGSELEGLTELAKEQLRLPAQLGFPVASFSGMVDKLDSPIYSTSIGLILWGIEEMGTPPGIGRFDLGKFGGVFDKFRGIFKNFTN
jgi:cell division protein FtsA